MQLTAALCNMHLSPGTGSDVWWDTLPECPTSWPSERRWALGFLSPSAWSAVCPAAPASRCPSPDTGTQIVFSTQRTTRENEKWKAPTPSWHLFVFICATSQLYFHTLGWSWELHWEVYLEVVLLRFSLALLGVLNEETVVAALFQFHNNVQEARGAASGAFGESFVIPGQNPPGDIEEQMSMTEEKDRATAKETDVRKSPLTCRTASAARTCRRGGSAPPWQAETFPRLSWHGAAGKARGLCAGSDSRCPFPGRVCPQSPPTSQICSRKKKKKRCKNICRSYQGYLASQLGRTCQAWGSAAVTRALSASSAVECRWWGVCDWTWIPWGFCTTGSRHSSACAPRPHPGRPSWCSPARPAHQMSSPLWATQTELPSRSDTQCNDGMSRSQSINPSTTLLAEKSV